MTEMTDHHRHHLNHREKVKGLLPHLLLGGFILLFLFLDFLYYRRSHGQKYQRKTEKRAHQAMSLTPKRITSMMRYHHSSPPSSSSSSSSSALDKPKVAVPQSLPPLFPNGVDSSFPKGTTTKEEAISKVAAYSYLNVSELFPKCTAESESESSSSPNIMTSSSNKFGNGGVGLPVSSLASFDHDYDDDDDHDRDCASSAVQVRKMSMPPRPPSQSKSQTQAENFRRVSFTLPVLKFGSPSSKMSLKRREMEM